MRLRSGTQRATKKEGEQSNFLCCYVSGSIVRSSIQEGMENDAAHCKLHIHNSPVSSGRLPLLQFRLEVPCGIMATLSDIDDDACVLAYKMSPKVFQLLLRATIYLGPSEYVVVLTSTPTTTSNCWCSHLRVPDFSTVQTSGVRQMHGTRDKFH